MTRMSRLIALTAVLLALSWVVPRAQTTAGQKPPEAAAKPDPAKQPAADQANQAPAATARPQEIAPEDYPPDYKAFNEVAKETNALKRVELYEKFIADNPKSELASMAKSQMQSTLATVLKDAQKKYLDLVTNQADTAKKAENAAMNYATFNRLAGDLLGSGVLLEQAEEYSRTGLSMMDEQKYIDARKQAGQQPAATAAQPAFVPSFSMRDGIVTVRAMRPRASTGSSAQSPRPPLPTDAELRSQFRSEKASAQATLGQILLKRGKTEEGERMLKEAYAARPSSYTLATVARLLAESAKKAGDDRDQLEYLTALALSGRITAAERKDFEAVYRKTHGGSLDGVEEMLDERYRRENPRFAVTPAAHKATPNGRAVLVEMFTGAG